jgi:hypothetical protein
VMMMKRAKKEVKEVVALVVADEVLDVMMKWMSTEVLAA